MPQKTSKEDSTIRAAYINRRGLFITGAFTLLAATVTAGWWAGLFSSSTKYFVINVRNKTTEEPVRAANVRLETEGLPPLIQSSDTNGLARFRVDDPKKEVRIWIEADGFNKGDWKAIPADNGNFDARLTPNKIVVPSPTLSVVSPSVGTTSTPVTTEKIVTSRYIANCRSLFEKGEFKAALTQCNKALSIAPSNKEAVELKRRIEETVKILNK